MEYILYTIDCPNCKILENKLREKNINFTICKDIDLMEAKGYIYLPILTVDGEEYNFNNAIKYLEGVIK